MGWFYASSRASSSSKAREDSEDNRNRHGWSRYRQPSTWIPLVVVAVGTWYLSRLYNRHLKRIPAAALIRPDSFRTRTLLGKVTSVGDGDNFHLFHTPGGILAGWGWLRKVPSDKTILRGRTILRLPVALSSYCARFQGLMRASTGREILSSRLARVGKGNSIARGLMTLTTAAIALREWGAPVASGMSCSYDGARLRCWCSYFCCHVRGRQIPIRIAGVDAPEGAHFGRPAQPHADEALAWLQAYVLDRRVRCRVYRRDQYDRAVATVYIRHPPFFVPRRDVGLEMLRAGLATVYEAKTGVEFGGEETEACYRYAEAKAKATKRGIWAAPKKQFESPRQYKTRWKDYDERAAAAAAAGKPPNSSRARR